MAKYETLKLVEALKVNPKTGVQLTQRQEIPFGAIIENPHEVRGFLRFGYLGQPYDVPYPDIEGYYKLIGGPAATASANVPAAVVTPEPQPLSHTSPKPDRPSLKFEALNANIAVSRARIPGGWLVAAGQGITFVPDAGHDWDGASI